MSRHRLSVLSALVPAVLALASAPAAASSVQVWDAAASNWSNNGVVQFTGPVVLGYVGVQWPCTAHLTATVNAGNAQITAASFSGTAVACSSMTPYLLPWPATPAAAAYAGANPPLPNSPVLTPVLWNLAISGVRFSFNGPPTFYCPSPSASGTINGVIDVADQAGTPPGVPTANRFVFRGPVGPCVLQTFNQSSLVADPAVRILP